jgi:hypothetical protein
MTKTIQVGDTVVPKPEWTDVVPAGRVVKVEPWGRDGAIWVEGSRCAFAAYVFRVVGAEPKLTRS